MLDFFFFPCRRYLCIRTQVYISCFSRFLLLSVRVSRSLLLHVRVSLVFSRSPWSVDLFYRYVVSICFKGKSTESGILESCGIQLESDRIWGNPKESYGILENLLWNPMESYRIRIPYFSPWLVFNKLNSRSYKHKNLQKLQQSFWQLKLRRRLRLRRSRWFHVNILVSRK